DTREYSAAVCMRMPSALRGGRSPYAKRIRTGFQSKALRRPTTLQPVMRTTRARSSRQSASTSVHPRSVVGVVAAVTAKGRETAQTITRVRTTTARTTATLQGAAAAVPVVGAVAAGATAGGTIATGAGAAE